MFSLGPLRYVNINKLDVIVILSEFFYHRLLLLLSSKDHIVQLLEMLIDLEFKYKVLHCGIFVKLFWSRIYGSINLQKYSIRKKLRLSKAQILINVSKIFHPPMDL
jgi:hypothetical protein